MKKEIRCGSKAAPITQPSSKRQIRCAIYTRKSSEEGLEQDFNSLDAQREACEAYIKSQMHEGWVLIPKEYSDGGFSGGTMERPAFKDLLSDIENDEIDIVVVYKVDRLTRSLMDFAKIVDIFDKHETSFVSITQQFSTTTSMGRLTLNILLSFAQFEREVTGERIRDKFAASKKKGMWMNGVAPIGYIKQNCTLIEDKTQSDKIKLIFEKYLEFKSVGKLHDYLTENKIHTVSDKMFSKGHLSKLLRNKVYIGKVEHKENIYEGLHDGIIDEKTFEKVQKIMDFNTVQANNALKARNSSLLAGKLFDSNGNYMSPSHSNNRHKKTYRYYTSQAIIQNRQHEAGDLSKIPATEIENFVKKQVNDFVKNKNEMQKYLEDFPVRKQTKILSTTENTEFDNVFVRTVIDKVTLYENKIDIIINKSILVKSLEALAYNLIMNFESDSTDIITLSIPAKLVATPQRGNKLIIGNEVEYNLTLIQAITKGFYYHKLWEEGKLTNEQKNSYTYRLMNLRLLPPKIIEAVLNGKQTPDITVKRLYELAKI